MLHPPVRRMWHKSAHAAGSKTWLTSIKMSPQATTPTKATSFCSVVPGTLSSLLLKCQISPSEHQQPLTEIHFKSWGASPATQNCMWSIHAVQQEAIYSLGLLALPSFCEFWAKGFKGLSWQGLLRADSWAHCRAPGASSTWFSSQEQHQSQ